MRIDGVHNAGRSAKMSGQIRTGWLTGWLS
jgi:hypothetical protein